MGNEVGRPAGRRARLSVRIEPLMPHQLLEVPTTKRCNARSPAASMKNGQVKPKKPGEACFSKFMVSCQLPIEDPGTRKRIIQRRSEFYGRECTHIFKYLIYFEYWQSNLFSENNISIQLMYTYIYIYINKYIHIHKNIKNKTYYNEIEIRNILTIYIYMIYIIYIII